MVPDHVYVKGSSIFILLMSILSFHTAYAQQPSFKLYEGQINWLADNHFPIHVYQWDYPDLNDQLKRTIEKRSLTYLHQSTIIWLDRVVADRYTGTELFREPRHANWLKRKNVHIEYYHGLHADMNAELNNIVRRRSFVDFTNVTGISTASVGAIIFLLSSLQYVANSLICIWDCEDHLREIKNRVNLGFNLTLTGTSVWLIGRLIGGGRRKARLKNFTQSWYREYKGY